MPVPWARTSPRNATATPFAPATLSHFSDKPTMLPPDLVERIQMCFQDGDFALVAQTFDGIFVVGGDTDAKVLEDNQR